MRALLPMARGTLASGCTVSIDRQWRRPPLLLSSPESANEVIAMIGVAAVVGSARSLRIVFDRRSCPCSTARDEHRWPAHGSGPMWFAIPSSQRTCTVYSLPVSRRTPPLHHSTCPRGGSRRAEELSFERRRSSAVHQRIGFAAAVGSRAGRSRHVEAADRLPGALHCQAAAKVSFLARPRAHTRDQKRVHLSERSDALIPRAP